MTDITRSLILEKRPKERQTLEVWGSLRGPNLRWRPVSFCTVVTVTNMRYGCHNQLIVTYDTHAECEDGILAEFATD